MQAFPKISVLLPCYRQERFVREAIESVVMQDFPDWEMVASDDASPDGTFALLEAWARRNSRIRVFRQEQNLGMVENWNFCLRQARGEAVKLVGGDDRLLRSDCLARQWSSLQQRGISLVASARSIIDEDSRGMRILANLPAGFFPSAEIIPRMLLHQDNLVGEPVCCLFRRSEANRGFDPSYRQNTDIEMWLHLLKQGGLFYEPQPLVAFRSHGRQASAANWQSGLALEEHRVLFCREAMHKSIPLRTKFQVLLRAEDTLGYAPSEKIREAAEQLARHLGSGQIFGLRIFHAVGRALSRWGRSVRKRLPFESRGIGPIQPRDS